MKYLIRGSGILLLLVGVYYLGLQTDRRPTSDNVILNNLGTSSYSALASSTGTSDPLSLELLAEKEIAQKISTSSEITKETSRQIPITSNTSGTTRLVRLNNNQIIQKVKPAVVYIRAGDLRGTGMVFRKDGYILTNAHVVKGTENVIVSTINIGPLDASVVGRNTKLDLAVLKISGDVDLPIVNFGDSDLVSQGDPVFTLGFPFGINGDVSFKEGTLSRRIDGVLEISAEIHPGNSGGPLVNQYGQVIGINSSSFGNSIEGIQVGETIKFAIPINIAKENIDLLLSGYSDVDHDKENIDKISAILLDIELLLAAQNYDSCSDASMQEMSGNYFAAKRKIEDCLIIFANKKEEFEKIKKEETTVLVGMKQDYISEEDLNYINGKVALALIAEEYEYKTVQKIIEDDLGEQKGGIWRDEMYKLATKCVDDSVVYTEMAITRIREVTSRMKK